MKRLRAIALGVCVLGASHAWAHGGCTPGSQDQLKCQDALAKGLAKLVKSVITCHIKQADGAFKSAPIDDEACEETDAVKSAKAKFDAAVTKVAALCSDPSAVTAANTVRDEVLGTGFAFSLDDINGQIYCEGASDIDPSGDDPGKIPSSQDFLKCEDAAHKNLAKLVAGLFKCHVKSFDTLFKSGTFDLDFCESDAVKGASGKYDAAADKINLKPCPGCLDTNAQKAIGTDVKGGVNAVIPEIYPCPTTTSTSTSTSTSSTTSTTVLLPCACGAPDPTKLLFTTAGGAGNCGAAISGDGVTFKSLACGGLYFGGGGNTVPLPATVPDYGGSVYKVTNCNGPTLTVAGTANGELGADARTCTNAGCLYGPPLPIPNSSSTPTSTCVINTVATNAAGSASCSSGSADITIPLNSEIFLAGDILPDAGIQPCPICVSRPMTGACTTGTCCKGGPNDNQDCMPGDTVLGTAGPTSHDCPPDPLQDIGGLPIGYVLSTGTITTTAVAGTVDIAATRVFCGYCRDADISGCFEGDPDTNCPLSSPGANKCIDVTPGGVGTSNTCSGTFEACEQRSNGAFGPAGGGVQTLTETGTAAGDLTDHAVHNGTLVSIFCIPPTFNATVDAAANLPGPGAVSLPGQVQVQ